MQKKIKPQFSEKEVLELQSKFDDNMKTIESDDEKEKEPDSKQKQISVRRLGIKFRAIFGMMMNEYSDMKQKYGFGDESEASQSSSGKPF